MKRAAMIVMAVLTLMTTLCFSAFAGSAITFEWDANTEVDLAGYRLYQSTASGEYAFGDGQQVATIPAGTETGTLDNVPDGTYYWVLTAYDDQGNESDPSNEVTEVLDTSAPIPPGNLVITLIQKLIAFLKGLFCGGLKSA